MKRAVFLAPLALALAAPAYADDPSYAEGTIFTNAEDSYFAEEEGRAQPDWIGLRFNGTAMEAVDAFGDAVAMPDEFTIIAHDENEIIATVNGVRTQLRRARPVTCWGGVKKTGEVPEGESDWVFGSGITLHDQGGRATMGGGDTGAPLAVIRIRRVTWAKGSSNRPSMVIYVHETREDMRAVSYSWADSEASRVGINLRWMQAGCTIEGADRASPVTEDNFRG